MAEIILEIFNAPLGKGLSINSFISETCRKILAGQCAVGGVYSELESHTVDLFNKCGNTARKVGKVTLKSAVFISNRGLPAVIDIHINIAGLRQSGIPHGLCGLGYEPLVYPVSEGVPARPAHGRSQRCAVVILGINRECELDAVHRFFCEVGGIDFIGQHVGHEFFNRRCRSSCRHAGKRRDF